MNANSFHLVAPEFRRNMTHEQYVGALTAREWVRGNYASLEEAFEALDTFLRPGDLSLLQNIPSHERQQEARIAFDKEVRIAGRQHHVLEMEIWESLNRG